MLIEMTYEYDGSLPEQFAFHPETQPGFEKGGFIFNVCLRYLENMYEVQESTEDLQQYVNREMPKLKEQIQASIVLWHFHWAIWSLIMIDWDNLKEAEEFLLPYGK